MKTKHHNMRQNPDILNVCRGQATSRRCSVRAWEPRPGHCHTRWMAPAACCSGRDRWASDTGRLQTLISHEEAGSLKGFKIGSLKLQGCELYLESSKTAEDGHIFTTHVPSILARNPGWFDSGLSVNKTD